MGLGGHACIHHRTVFIVTLREYLGSIVTYVCIFRFRSVCEDQATKAHDEVSCMLDTRALCESQASGVCGEGGYYGGSQTTG